MNEQYFTTCLSLLLAVAAENPKDTTQELLQSVYDRQAHSDQEVPTAHSQELQQLSEYNHNESHYVQ